MISRERPDSAIYVMVNRERAPALGTAPSSKYIINMSSPLDRALQDRLSGPLTAQRMADVCVLNFQGSTNGEAAMRRAQRRKREIIVLEDTPVQTRVGNRSVILRSLV